MRNGQDDFKRKSVSFDESVKNEQVIKKSYHQKTINTSRTSEQKKKDSERNYTKTCRKYDIVMCDIIGKKRWKKAQDICDPRCIKINKYIIKLARNTSVNSIIEDFPKNKSNELAYFMCKP